MKFVIFIDDDEDFRHIVSHQLSRWKRSWTGEATVRVSNSTSELLDMLDETREGDRLLLITDGNMRAARGFDLDGDELIEAVRTKLGDRLARAVIMTGRPEEFQASGDRLGAEVYKKPLESDELKRIVTEFVES